MIGRMKQGGRGFTLVEMIVTSVILCGAVLALGAISTRSLVGTRLNRQYEVAAALADRQLRLIDYIGVDNFIEFGQKEGEFEQFEPGYHWEVITESVGIGNLYLVKVTVSWVERNRPYSISVDTRLNGVGRALETEE
jgi:prepilin-type N-terminal cleavage/methylation domain-containing protein